MFSLDPPRTPDAGDYSPEAEAWRHCYRGQHNHGKAAVQGIPGLFARPEERVQDDDDAVFRGSRDGCVSAERLRHWPSHGPRLSLRYLFSVCIVVSIMVVFRLITRVIFVASTLEPSLMDPHPEGCVTPTADIVKQCRMWAYSYSQVGKRAPDWPCRIDTPC